MTSRSERGAPRGARLRAARLGAVQALYQLDMDDAAAPEVIRQFIEHHLDWAADVDLFEELVGGAARDYLAVDEKIIAVLSAGWTIDRLETVLRAIMRVGVWELMFRLASPARTVVVEYVEIARSFFAGREPAMVNGVLDRIAHDLRPLEFTDP